MYLQMDLMENLLSSHPVQKVREFSIELYLNGWFGFIENPDLEFCGCSDLS